jgi:hypothetical protein
MSITFFSQDVLSARISLLQTNLKRQQHEFESVHRTRRQVICLGLSVKVYSTKEGGDDSWVEMRLYYLK